MQHQLRTYLLEEEPQVFGAMLGVQQVGDHSLVECPVEPGHLIERAQAKADKRIAWLESKGMELRGAITSGNGKFRIALAFDSAVESDGRYFHCGVHPCRMLEHIMDMKREGFHSRGRVLHGFSRDSVHAAMVEIAALYPQWNRCTMAPCYANCSVQANCR
ncbi:hypothetical protein HB13667_03010 [Pseudomonas putida]|uniref:Uncharacterized protein n=1 Tax=Pseudomonas putida TaxID=303 RepID=A0A0P7DEK5_PSEPU|nr:hypothetical protein HB13667_03010 [Pseudomonas putida]